MLTYFKLFADVFPADGAVLILMVVLSYIVAIFQRIILPFGILLYLIWFTVKAIRRPRLRNRQTDRRLVAAVLWLVALSIVGGIYFSTKQKNRQELSYNRQVAAVYAKQYDHPVILSNLPYSLKFDQSEAYIMLHFKHVPYVLTQKPITDANRKYFTPDQNLCDTIGIFSSDVVRLPDPRMTCGIKTIINGYDVYMSSGSKSAYVYGNGIFLWVLYGNHNSKTFAPGDTEKIINSLFLTDKNELSAVVNSDQFSLEYTEVLDRWYREGKYN